MRRRTRPLSPNYKCRVHIPSVLYNHMTYEIAIWHIRDLGIKTSKERQV